MRNRTFTSVGTEVDAIAGALDAAGVSLGAPSAITRTRLDTFDGRLHAAGLQLEGHHHRADGVGTNRLVLTGPHGPAAQLTLTHGAVAQAPVCPEDLPPGPMRTRLIDVCAGRILLPQVVCTASRREGRRCGAAGEPQLLVHLDTSLEVDGAPLGVAWAVEVASLPGTCEPAEHLRRQLQGQGFAVHPWGVLELALEAAEVDPKGWRAASLQLEAHEPALAGFRTVLRGLALDLDAHWEGTAQHLDSEFLHHLRIAVRRTRSVLTQSAHVLPEDVRVEYAEVFRWLGGLTGPARDLDVYVEGWDDLIADLTTEQRRSLDPVLARFRAQRAAAHAEVTAALGSERARVVRDGWRDWLALPDEAVTGGPDAQRPLGVVAGKRLRTAQRRLLTRGRRIDPSSPATALHDLRKDAKRLRYLLESFGSLGGAKRKQQMVRHLKRLQDNLGDHQDAEVQAERLRATVTELGRDGPPPPIAVTALERLAGELDARHEAAREEFASRFAAYERQAVRRTLRELTGRMAG